ncbi:hypothetical protein NHX12_023988 [Muraenolepis orangiensis]|uniref:Uncharacterized protein n=1 Tax=Muraenolepis orangiensis TaxID=630683 RepID=A0A9Q0ES06_9TELE|nr:hypothetical protein NHX12_023988 [Muraenolepis orangiensis]
MKGCHRVLCHRSGAESWGTEGCQTLSSTAVHQTKCLCSRISTYAVLAQQAKDPDMGPSSMPSVPLMVGCGVSCSALIILLLIYAAFWRYIRSERSIILVNFCLSILASNMLILVGQSQTLSKGLCTVTAAFLHFFFLSSFCWVLTEAWQSYLSVIGKMRSRLIRKRFLCLGWACIYLIGGPDPWLVLPHGGPDPWLVLPHGGPDPWLVLPHGGPDPWLVLPHGGPDPWLVLGHGGPDPWLVLPHGGPDPWLVLPHGGPDPWLVLPHGGPDPWLVLPHGGPDPWLVLPHGLPALVVAVSVGFTRARGYGTASYCWLSLEGGLLYAFVGPAAVIVLVNMLIGIVVFNKLMSRDGISDKSKKQRAG